LKVFFINSNKVRADNFIQWLMYLFGHTIVLISVSLLFESLYISNTYFGLYGLIATIMISILNATIKPVIVLLTLPITGITLGLFYPFINVFILKIVDFLLGNNFELRGIWIAFFIALLISIMNILMDSLIIKPLLKKGEIL